MCFGYFSCTGVLCAFVHFCIFQFPINASNFDNCGDSLYLYTVLYVAHCNICYTCIWLQAGNSHPVYAFTASPFTQSCSPSRSHLRNLPMRVYRIHLTMRVNIELCSSSGAQTKRLHPLNAPFSIPRPSCFFCSTAEQLGRIIELARYREIETSEFLPSTVNYVNTRYKTWENENGLNGQGAGSSIVKEKRILFYERSVCFDIIIMMVRRDSVRNFTADFHWSETVKRRIFIPQTHTHVLTYTKRHTC